LTAKVIFFIGFLIVSFYYLFYKTKKQL